MALRLTVDQTHAFMGYMDAHNDEDLPDGAWFAMLEEGAGSFIEQEGISTIDSHDLVNYYLKLLSNRPEEE